MTTEFKTDDSGFPYLIVDPDSQLDVSVATWLEGQTFASLVWTLDPPIAGALYASAINAQQVTANGVTYEIGELATTWIKDIPAGARHVVTLRATFAGGQVDDRSFVVKGREK